MRWYVWFQSAGLLAPGIINLKYQQISGFTYRRHKQFQFCVWPLQRKALLQGVNPNSSFSIRWSSSSHSTTTYWTSVCTSACSRILLKSEISLKFQPGSFLSVIKNWGNSDVGMEAPRSTGIQGIWSFSIFLTGRVKDNTCDRISLYNYQLGSNYKICTFTSLKY